MSKKPKYRRRRENNKKEFKEDVLKWILFTVIYIGLIIVIYGTAKVYYPNPIPFILIFGFQLYGDISTGICYGGIAMWSIISIFIFKTKL